MTTPLLVCIVDDTDDYRFLIEKIFKRYFPNYLLRSFSSGQDFLDILPELSEKPSLVLLDQHMPQLSGYQTLVALKKQIDYRLIPVVMISGDASHSEITSFYEAGAATYFQKSMTFSALERIVIAACQYASNYSEC